MQYDFAPLEGITDAVYRRTHHRFYPGLTRYYTPFISPTKNHIFTPRDLRELSPENNPGLSLVPQLLGKNAEDLLWALGELSTMGYAEANLNLGCPSGTVTAKGKGAGALVDPAALDRLLDTIFSRAPIALSVKTRLGLKDPREFEALLPVFERYPIRRLIIHPRTAAQMYAGEIHMDMFSFAYGKSPLPLCYNGDLRTRSDIDALRHRFPGLSSIMLGRGLVTDPGLLTEDRSDTLLAFHEALCREYPVVFRSENSALHRMKAIWFYMVEQWPEPARLRKQIIKTKRWDEFLALSRQILSRDRKG